MESADKTAERVVMAAVTVGNHTHVAVDIVVVVVNSYCIYSN